MTPSASEFLITTQSAQGNSAFNWSPVSTFGVGKSLKKIKFE